MRASPSHAPPRFPGRHAMMHASLRVKVLLKDLRCFLYRVSIDSCLLPVMSRYGPRQSIHRRHLGSAHKVCCPSNGVGVHSAWRAVSSRWRSVSRLICIRVTPRYICRLTLVHQVASALPPLNPRYVIKSVPAHPLSVLAQKRLSLRKPY